MCTGQAYSLTKPKAPFVTQASWWAEDLTQRGFSTMASATDIFESKVRAGPPCHSHSRRLASSPRCERMPSHLVCIRQSLTGESLFVCRRASANRFVSLPPVAIMCACICRLADRGRIDQTRISLRTSTSRSAGPRPSTRRTVLSSVCRTSTQGQKSAPAATARMSGAR